ncbi:hypothetical protein MNBD_ALPHA06-2036 [hydrothermal vent metagenome]|uniref:Two-component transcriptional response regulator, LuxR family n=1 Tax=hydrothermal vent metagenome TaxID=652676 RepID=A0A3B0RZ12_9ZZZZ
MSNQRSIRILLADDEALVRQGMAALLATEFDKVVEAADGEQALSCLKQQTFDLALLDIHLPRRTGLDVLQEIQARGLPLKVIILTGDTDSWSPQDIYAAGADAFLYKTADAEHFLETVLAVASDQTLPDMELADGANAGSIARLREQLTARELQVVKLAAEGLANKQMANVLGISDHTVRKHREHINRKLGFTSPTALAAFAIKAGLI